MTPRTILPCLLAVALAAAGARAQTVTIRGETLTPIGVRASHPDGASDARVVPANTKFTTGFSVKAASLDCTAEASATIAGGKAVAKLAGQVAGNTTYTRGTSGFFGNPATKTGPVRMAFAFQADRPVAGRMLVRMTPRAYSGWTYDNRVTAKVAVGSQPPARTTSLWAAPVTKEFPVTLTSFDTIVTLELTGEGSSLGPKVIYDLVVEAHFVPGPSVASYGESCGHLWTAFPSKDTLALTYQMGVQRAPTLLAFGANRADWPFPPGWTGCRLFVAPMLIVAGGKAGMDGLASATFKLPAHRVDFLVQAFAVQKEMNRMMSTNAADVRLTDR